MRAVCPLLQKSGDDRPKGEPLLTLSKYRRTKEGVFFGVFLQAHASTEAPWLCAGDALTIVSRENDS
jgi:uncharacterized protein YcbX